MTQKYVNSRINLYYGTKNLELDFKYKIDPDFDGIKRFEFGNGFYLTPNRDLAESYIRHEFLVDSVRPAKRPSLDEMIKGINGKGHLHIYKLDYNALSKDGKIKSFEEIDEYRNILEETLIGYNNSIDYRPDRDATFGQICGQFWDDYWDESNPKRGTLNNKELVNKCMEEIENSFKKKERQICIHRKLIGTAKKNIFNEYLKKIKCQEIEF